MRFHVLLRLCQILGADPAGFGATGDHPGQTSNVGMQYKTFIGAIPAKRSNGIMTVRILQLCIASSSLSKVKNSFSLYKTCCPHPFDPRGSITYFITPAPTVVSWLRTAKYVR